MVTSPQSHRHVDVFELARTGGALRGSVAIATLPRLQPSLAQSQGALDFRLRGFVDARGRPAAELEFAGTAQLICDRCGKPVVHDLAGKAIYYFVRSERELARIPVDESVEEPLLGSSRFDLNELLEDEAILCLPISPRHEACGTAMVADTPAPSTTADKPHPFAALARLKSRPQ
jgi:uncharacterized protein